MTRPRATTSPSDALGATIADLKARLARLENIAHQHNTPATDYVRPGVAPAFDAHLTSDTTVTVPILFNAVHVNIGGHYNPANGRFTAPITGRYWFYMQLLSPNSTVNLDTRFYINGARQGRYAGFGLLGVSSFKQSILGAVIPLNAGDYVQGGLFSSATVFGNSTNGHSRFAGFLIS